MNITIDNQLVTLSELRQAWLEPLTLTLGLEAKRRIAESNEYINEVVAGGSLVYGINTGFGMLANVRISDEELGQLQALSRALSSFVQFRRQTAPNGSE